MFWKFIKIHSLYVHTHSTINNRVINATTHPQTVTHTHTHTHTLTHTDKYTHSLTHTSSS